MLLVLGFGVLTGFTLHYFVFKKKVLTLCLVPLYLAAVGPVSYNSLGYKFCVPGRNCLGYFVSSWLGHTIATTGVSFSLKSRNLATRLHKWNLIYIAPFKYHHKEYLTTEAKSSVVKYFPL